MSLAEEILEEGEGELWISTGFMRLIIAKQDLIYEVSYFPALYDSGRINELSPILREILPFEIYELSRWKYWRGLPDSQERIDALTEG